MFRLHNDFSLTSAEVYKLNSNFTFPCVALWICWEHIESFSKRQMLKTEIVWETPLSMGLAPNFQNWNWSRLM